MKRALLFFVLLSQFALAQGFNAFQQTTFTSVTVGTTLIENTVIGFNQLSWTVSGTVSTCTVSLDSSPDGSTWTVGGIITGQTCTTNGNSIVTAGSANFMRVNMTALSGAGATVVVTYKGWVVNPSGGSGTTINPTNNLIPVRSNATTFVDSHLTDNGTSVITSEQIKLPNGAAASGSGALTFTNDTGVSVWACNPGGGWFCIASQGGDTWLVADHENKLDNTFVVAWSSGVASTFGTEDTTLSRTAAGVVAVGTTNSAGSENGLLRWNECRVTADITLPVNTATTVCSWSLPAVAKAWAWQCQIPWVISAGTGTNTLAIIANPSQTPGATTNGSAEIKTTNTNTATEATTAISASGGTTLLTSGTITPAATVFMSSTSGTLSASATAGTFAIQMTAAGTTATAAAKAGATCMLY